MANKSAIRPILIESPPGGGGSPPPPRVSVLIMEDKDTAECVIWNDIAKHKSFAMYVCNFFIESFCVQRNMITLRIPPFFFLKGSHIQKLLHPAARGSILVHHDNSMFNQWWVICDKQIVLSHKCVLEIRLLD